ncbi:DsbA family protein [Candidatus Dojkabacteria bacterium]|uniref:DsbA family protein n=1 Tax=Candidatus Dojkabacteria bacterium TaxID=2099670 RepID=A0A955L9Q3_9BACT|nr:DsbA family protein [Candidatus Dojkabacteria bacterium]
MKKETQEKPSDSSSDVITLDVAPFIMPISIVVSAFILSIALFMSVGRIGLSTSSDAADTGGNNAPIAEAPNNIPPAAPPANQDAKVNIDDDPILGDKSKVKVALVEFSDYECPFCKKFHTETFDQIKADYIDTGKIAYVFRDFPLSFHDPLATKQAMAAECVQDLAGDNKYYEYSDLIFTNTSSNGQGMDESKLYDLAQDIGVDRGQFTECLDSEKFKEEVQKDMADGSAAGISGTPGFVLGIIDEKGNVDGIKISGALPYSSFKTEIDKMLGE